MKTAIYSGWAGSPTSLEVGKMIADEFDLIYDYYGNYGDRADYLAPCDYLFSFGPVLFSGKALQAAKIAAINFHLGPPKYPGRKAVERAMANGDQEFGVTAHIMDEKIDHGPILLTDRWEWEGKDAQKERDYAFIRIPGLVRDMIRKLRNQDLLPLQRWGQ